MNRQREKTTEVIDWIAFIPKATETLLLYNVSGPVLFAGLEDSNQNLQRQHLIKTYHVTVTAKKYVGFMVCSIAFNRHKLSSAVLPTLIGCF